MKNRLISVIIPLYNNEQSISKALSSVAKQNGDFKFEIFIIDDGSTDLPYDKIEEAQVRFQDLNIRVLSQPHLGVSCARNLGLSSVSGDFIAFLDADDQWLSEKTMQQMKILSHETQRVDILASLRNDEKLLLPFCVEENNIANITFKKLLIRNTIAVSTVIMKRKILENTGFFQKEQNYAEDHDYWLRATEHNQLYILNESLVITGNGKRSFGESGLSANLWAMFKGYVQNLKRVQAAGRISKMELYLYIPFYFCKYLLLVIRTALRKQRK